MKVLVADDDAFYRLALGEALERWGYEVVAASDGNVALQVLQGVDPPRIAILDWMMPGMDGIEVCCKVRKRTQDPYIYIMLVTAKNQVGDVVAGLQAEADDYLVKPFDFQELRARVRAGQRVVDMHSAQAAKQLDLSYRANHDLLTGLWNRAGILEIAGKGMARTEREGKPLCLALADIDHFKTVNDEFGHTVGDGVLREVAQRMRSVMRSYDDIGRYGGEEFLVVMPGFDMQHAIKQAERLRRHVGENPFDVLEKQISITISLGVAINSGDDGTQSLIHAADAALYRAKARGRNQVEIAGAKNEYTEPRVLTDQHG